MRIFSTEQGWVVEEQEFATVYFIDGKEYSPEDYYMEMKAETKIQPEQIEPQIEFTEEDKQDIAFVEQFAYAIENIKESGCTCGGMLRSILYDLLCTAREVGYAEAYKEMEDDLEDEESQNITINMGKIVVSDSANPIDFLKHIDHLVVSS